MKTYGNDFESKSWDITSSTSIGSKSLTHSNGIKIISWNDGELIHTECYEFKNGEWIKKIEKTYPSNFFRRFNRSFDHRP